MLCGVKLQAHRGVSTECPENTMAAFYASYLQGYDIIETDPMYTSDGQFVIMHDKTINRTGRMPDGSEIGDEIKITDITYAEALKYDFGAWFSNKFKGEKIPLFSELLEFSKKNAIPVKIDNKVAQFPEGILSSFFDLVEKSGAEAGFTCFDTDFVKKVSKRFPNADIHYDGKLDEEILKELSTLCAPGRLTVWVPVKSKLTSWVDVEFADRKICETIKKYAKLGVWILSEYEEFETAREYGADIVETTGSIKPEKYKGIRADMHNHTRNSHDSESEPDELAESHIAAGSSVFAVTDHFDVEYSGKIDYDGIIGQSVKDAAYLAEKYKGRIEVLKGIEVGEGIWNKEETERMLRTFDFDVVIGSVHAVRYEGFETPFARIDFSAMDEEKLIDYMHAYFDDMEEMLETTELDILAHIASPLKYSNAKYSHSLSSHVFEDRIEKILEFVIKHGIILEVNTAALGSGYDELLAEEWVLKKYRDMGGYMICVGSDSHTTKNAAHEFDRAYKILKDIGFKNAFYVKNRVAISYTL